MTQAPALSLFGEAKIGGKSIFAGVDLKAQAGEWTVILGASGVGKSTVLRLFAGLTEGIDLTGDVSASTGPLRGQVALMAQDDLLLPWLSVLDNVLIGSRLRGEKPNRCLALERLEQVGLADRAASMTGTLSGGQRQRVALARTLIEDRPIVLLDEPFSALDALTRTQMQDLSATVLTGRTVLLVTHDPAEAVRLGHRIYIMSDTGLAPIPAPVGDIPRPFDAPEILSAQAHLLSCLRKVK